MPTLDQDPCPPPSADVSAGALRAFERLLLSLSTELVGASSQDLHDAIFRALREVACAIDADRGFVSVFSPDGATFTCVHDWCRPPFASAMSRFSSVPADRFPWIFAHLRTDSVAWASVESLPQAAWVERAFMQSEGIQNLLAVPLTSAGRLFGLLGFDWLRGAARWSDDLRGPVRVLGQLLASAMVRERSELLHLRAEERLRSFLSHTPDAVHCFEPDGAGIPLSLPVEEQAELWLDFRLVDCNPAFARFRQVEPSELIGKRLREVAARSVPVLREHYRRLVAANYQLEEAEFSTVVQGAEVTVLVNSQGVVEEGLLRRVWTTYRDITERKRATTERARLETQLHQAQRMESVGLLAGGIAHDFNNLLVGILGYAQVARDMVRTDPEGMLDAIAQVLAAGERAALLTRQLLTFSRHQPLQRQAVDLNQVISGVLRLLRRTIRESIEIDFIPGHDLGVVQVDVGQMEQVLVNLCVNASDAIGEVGRVVLETENVIINGSYTKAHPWARPGRYVLLSVTDTGGGMPPQVVDRIFEPFFSTKAPGEGTGLGLAVVYGIVTRHEGMINVYSEPGLGTTFKIYLPIVLRSAAHVGTKVESRVVGGTETILVAEDEELVRKVVRSVLERGGYRVLEARDGGEAVRLFEQHAEEIDLVLLDAVMPIMSGRIAHEHILARRPQTKILFSSGYTRDVFPEGFFVGREDQLIAKPYDADTLLRAVRASLDHERRPEREEPSSTLEHEPGSLPDAKVEDPQ